MSCSAMSGEHSPARSSEEPDDLNGPTPAPCFWMRSVTCRWKPKRSCYEYCETAWSIVSEGPNQSQPPTPTFRQPFGRERCAQTCSTAHISPIALPPLRDRREDIPLLAQHFLAQIGGKLKRAHLTFESQSMARLLTYNWPGNVREHKNVIEHAVILSDSSQVTVDEMLLPVVQAVRSPSSSQPVS